MNARTFAVSIVGTLLAVLTLVTAAGAECAWVVWEVNWIDETRTGFYPDKWQPRHGFTSADACVTALGHLSEREGKRSHFRCLPDTIDPRGPKVIK
jgi:hypothetical protein